MNKHPTCPRTKMTLRLPLVVFLKTEDVSKCGFVIHFSTHMHTLALKRMEPIDESQWKFIRARVRTEHGPVIVSPARENRGSPQ